MTQLLSLVSPSTIVSDGTLIEPGDCAIILKPDGTYRTASLGFDDITAETLTDAMRQQVSKMLALSAALQSEQVMQMLHNLVVDPTIVDQSKIVNLGAKH